MLFKFTLFIFLGFQIHKLLLLNLFFKSQCLITDYGKKVIHKEGKSKVYSNLAKISEMDFMYLIMIFIGFFTINSYFFILLIILSNIQSLFFKMIKNKKFRKIIYLSNIIASTLLLIIILINLYFYNLNSLDFIHKFLNF